DVVRAGVDRFLSRPFFGDVCRVGPDPVAHVVDVIAVGVLVHPRVETFIHNLLAKTGVSGAEPWHAVDDVGDEVVAVEFVPHHHVEVRCRRALLLVAPLSDVCVAVGTIDAAASTSTVGMSPAQPRTTSGSSPSTSVPAHGQIPTPRVQWRTASSIVNQLGLGCFPHTTTLTYWVERRQWSNVERSVLASGGRYTRTTSAFLLTTWSMKPGSWWENPLWSWRHTY